MSKDDERLAIITPVRVSAASSQDSEERLAIITPVRVSAASSQDSDERLAIQCHTLKKY